MKGHSTRPAIVQPKRSAVATAVSTVIVATAISAPARSQEIEEVIVTATKRAETVQEVPLAITVLTGNFIQATNLNDVKDLITFTPGITGNSQDSFIDAVSVRGDGVDCHSGKNRTGNIGRMRQKRNQGSGHSGGWVQGNGTRRQGIGR